MAHSPLIHPSSDSNLHVINLSSPFRLWLFCIQILMINESDMPSALGLVLNWMFILPVLTVSFLVVPESLYAHRHCQCCTLMLECCDNLSNHFSLSPFAPPRRSCFLPMLRKYAYEGLRSPLQFLFLLLLLLLLLATGCCFARAPPTVSWLLLQLLQLQQPSHVIGACHA